MKTCMNRKVLRIHRQALIDKLKAMLLEVGIEIGYEIKFSHIIPESRQTGVSFAFADGTTSNASLLIGADGIHFIVRRYLHPFVTAECMGSVGIASALPILTIRLPPGQHEKSLSPASYHLWQIRRLCDRTSRHRRL